MRRTATLHLLALTIVFIIHPSSCEVCDYNQSGINSSATARLGMPIHCTELAFNSSRIGATELNQLADAILATPPRALNIELRGNDVTSDAMESFAAALKFVPGAHTLLDKFAGFNRSHHRRCGAAYRT